METKFCPQCRRFVKRELFTKNRNKPGGWGPYCLACKRAEGHRLSRLPSTKETRLRWLRRQGQKLIAKYNERNPIKKEAQKIMWLAIQAKKLVKPAACESCGSAERLDGHHDDYAKPLEVRWLCRMCHKGWHRLNGEALNANSATG